jgi:hypothetical protein
MTYLSEVGAVCIGAPIFGFFFMGASSKVIGDLPDPLQAFQLLNYVHRKYPEARIFSLPDSNFVSIFDNRLCGSP